MRSRPLCVLVLLGVVTANAGCSKDCDPNKKPGEIGGCHDDSARQGGETGACNEDGSCDPGLTCVAGQCLQCGVLEMPCCDSSDQKSGTCEEGTCAYSNDVGWYTCQTCGTAGADCCVNWWGEFFCEDGLCLADDSNGVCDGESACGGDFMYTVWAIDPTTCAKQPFTFEADDDASAEQCLVTTVKVAHPGLEWGEPSQDPFATEPQERPACPTNCSDFGTSGQTVTFYAFTDDQLHTCEQFKDNTCDWADNACP